MPVKHGPKGMRARLAGYTPRQRVAICHPCERGDGGAHPRYHRITGSWQSILTFDLFEPGQSGAVELEELDELADGDERPHVRAYWHARITTMPQRAIAEWDADGLRDARRHLGRLVSSVGQGKVEVRRGTEGGTAVSVHVYKRATMSEIAQSERVRESRNA